MFFFLLLSHFAFAQPHHKGVLSSINLGARFSSVLAKRGVIFYEGFQLDPVLGLFFFDDRVEFLGDSLGFRDYLHKDKIRWRTKVAKISDNPLFPAKRSLRLVSPDRPDSYEWSNGLEFYFPSYSDRYLGQANLTYAKDISKHHGDYLELEMRAKIFSTSVLGTILEPNLAGSLGWGSAAHNKYFYGLEKSDWNNLSYGFWVAFPNEADRYYPILQLMRFSTLGDNRNAPLAMGRNDGFLFSFIATFGILE